RVRCTAAGVCRAMRLLGGGDASRRAFERGRPPRGRTGRRRPSPPRLPDGPLAPGRNPRSSALSRGGAVKHVVVGTAGHIDHGKTSLVKALTGIDTDRLPEEKARGLTIDLGFAFLEEPGGPVIEIVHVPGHERFVKTM